MFFKSNVAEGICDSCKEGHFNLQETNPDGCMECFCFGKTTFCSSNTHLQRSEIVNMSGWESVTFNFDNKAATVSSLEIDPLPIYSGILSLSKEYKGKQLVN